MEHCVECLGDIDPEEDAYTNYNGLYVCGTCEHDKDRPNEPEQEEARRAFAEYQQSHDERQEWLRQAVARHDRR